MWESPVAKPAIRQVGGFAQTHPFTPHDISLCPPVPSPPSLVTLQQDLHLCLRRWGRMGEPIRGVGADFVWESPVAKPAIRQVGGLGRLETRSGCSLSHRSKTVWNFAWEPPPRFPRGESGLGAPRLYIACAPRRITRENVESCAKSVQLSTSTETGSYFRLIDSCITQRKA